MFTDRIKLQLRAGKGGNGVVAWRREKYIPKGGPCGGDGGKGGSVIIEADTQVPSLDAFRHRRHLNAEHGGQGGTARRKGKNGKDLIIKVPCGTLVKNSETGEVLYDLTEDKQKIEICRGGRGGKGNVHFKSPTNRAPNQCTPGRKGEESDVELELKLIADVGLVGFPNAGKSTLISQVTNVQVKIAPYPFTTLRPNLGFIIRGLDRILLADIPGIISGAHKNKGLGHEFLRHIERTKVLLYVIDSTSEEPLADLQTLKDELSAYNPELLDKPSIVAFNKADLGQEIPQLEDALTISAINKEGLPELIKRLKQMMAV